MTKKTADNTIVIEYDPYCYIYEVKNSVTEKRYIGQTKNIQGRKREHLSNLKYKQHYNKELQKDFNKYGERNFQFSVIEKVLEENANEREKYWIKSLKERDLSYNVYNGGASDNKHLSLEAWKNCVLSHIGKKHKMSTIEKMKKSQRARFDKIAKLKEKGLINV